MPTPPNLVTQPRPRCWASHTTTRHGIVYWHPGGTTPTTRFTYICTNERDRHFVESVAGYFEPRRRVYLLDYWNARHPA